MKQIFSIVTVLCLSLGALQLGLAQTTRPLIKDAMDRLEEIGFPAERILQKESQQAGLKFVLLRCKSETRVYDLSLFSENKVYLSVSYNEGKSFGKVRSFDKLQTALDIIERIEGREREKKTGVESEGGVLPGIADSGSDQRQGLSEAQKKRQQKSKREGQEVADKLEDTLSAMSAAGGGSSGASDPLAEAKGAALDKKTSNLAEDFTGNPCGGQTNTATQPVEAGVAGAAKQIGEAAMATAIAEAFAMTASGLKDSSGLEVGGTSKYFNGDITATDLTKITNLAGEYANSSVSRRTALLRQILLSVIDERNLDSAKTYRSIQELYSRFKKWAAGEGFDRKMAQESLRELASTLIMDEQAFNRVRDSYPIDQQYNFYVQRNDKLLLINPQAAGPLQASQAFFSGATLYLSSLEPTNNEAFKALSQLRKQLIETEESIFATSPEKQKALLLEQEKLFEAAKAAIENIFQTLEENPIANPR